MNKLLLIKKLHLEKSRRKFQLKFKASSHYTQRYIIIQCIDKIETCLSKLKFNKPLENDEVGALALITEAKKIIDDFYANSEYIDSNNVSDIDCFKCYRLFTISIRAKGSFIYQLYNSPSPTGILCKRYCISNIKKYFHDKEDYGAEYTFPKFYSTLLEFVKLVCGEDWLTSYMHLMYKHRKSDNIIFALCFFPDFHRLREYVSNLINQNTLSSNTLPSSFELYHKLIKNKLPYYNYSFFLTTINNISYYTQVRLNDLSQKKLESKTYESSQESYANYYSEELHLENIYDTQKELWNVCHIIYNGTPMLIHNMKSAPISRSSFEEFLNFKFNRIDSEIFDDMVNNLSEFLKDIISETTYKTIAEKLFIQFRIVAPYPQKPYLFEENIISREGNMPIMAIDVERAQLPEQVYSNFADMVLERNIKFIDKFCTAMTMCMMPINVVKKLIIIKTDTNHTAEIMWKNLTKVDSFGSTTPLVKNENNYHADILLERLCTEAMLKKLSMLQNNGLKCIYVNAASKNLLKAEREILIEIIKHTDVQVVVFQQDESTHKFDEKDYIYLDLSKGYPDFCSKEYNVDLVWAKIHLSIYGLHCIWKSKGNPDALCLNSSQIFKTKTKKQPDIIPGCQLKYFTQQFVNKYFVPVEEAEKRRKERATKAKALKRKYKHLSADEATAVITKELSDCMLGTTYRDDFLKYADMYIKNNLTKEQANNNGITPKAMLDYLRYNSEFSYGEITAFYTGRKRGYGFLNLSLKKPWDEKIIEKQIETPQTAAVDNSDTEKMNQFYQMLHDYVDFSNKYFKSYTND